MRWTPCGWTVCRLPGHSAPAVMRDVGTAARHHHQDEEQVRPTALRASRAGAVAACLRKLTALLCRDRRRLERRWAAVRQRLLPVSDGTGATLESGDLPGFVPLCTGLIARDQAELLPMAARLDRRCLPGADDG